MATLTITIDDALVAPLLGALAWKYPQVDLTGLTDAQMGRRYMRAMLVETWVEYRVAQAITEANAAFAAAQDEARAQAEAAAGGITE